MDVYSGFCIGVAWSALGAASGTFMERTSSTPKSWTQAALIGIVLSPFVTLLAIGVAFGEAIDAIEKRDAEAKCTGQQGDRQSAAAGKEKDSKLSD